MFHALARFFRRHFGSAMVFLIAYAPIAYAASVALAERYARGIPLVDAFLAPQIEFIHTPSFHPVMVLCASVGVAYIGFLCWLRSLR